MYRYWEQAMTNEFLSRVSKEVLPKDVYLKSLPLQRFTHTFQSSFLPYSFGQFFVTIRHYQAFCWKGTFISFPKISTRLLTKLCLFSAKVCK